MRWLAVAAILRGCAVMRLHFCGVALRCGCTSAGAHRVVCWLVVAAFLWGCAAMWLHFCGGAPCHALAGRGCILGRASGGASSRGSAASCVSVCCSSSIHGFVRYLNMSGRCLARIARFMRYRSRHCVLCLSNLSAASPIDSSVSCHRPLTSIAPKGGLPRGALCFVMAFL